jgi:hypothetical protein
MCGSRVTQYSNSHLTGYWLPFTAPWGGGGGDRTYATSVMRILVYARFCIYERTCSAEFFCIRD